MDFPVGDDNNSKMVCYQYIKIPALKNVVNKNLSSESIINANSGSIAI